MARRAKRITNSGQEIVSAFEFDEKLLEDSSLSIKIFPDYSEDWAEFVVSNRKNASYTPIHNHDIVIGPIADDTVGVQIRRYIMGYLPLKQLVEELRYVGDHAIQYFFGTEKAINLLRRI